MSADKELEKWKNSIVLSSPSPCKYLPLRKVQNRTPKIFDCFNCCQKKSMIISKWEDYNSKNLKNPIIVWCPKCGIEAPLVLKLGQEYIDAFCYFQDFYYKKPFVFNRNQFSEIIDYQKEFYWRCRRMMKNA